MIALRPFLLLVGRASMFWMGALVIFVVSITLAGLTAADAQLGLPLDGIILAAFLFPGCAGALAGSVIQEFQHTSLAFVLPDVRSRIASGFLVTGLAVTGVVVGSIAAMSSTPQNLPVLFVIGFAAYCLGGVFIDPLSTWVTSLNVVAAMLIVMGSRELARIVGDHPWMTLAVALGIGVAAFLRLFARSTFRRKPFHATSPFPGRFSFERSRQFQRQRMFKNRPRRAGWHGGYLGNDAWRWVRAAIHEVHGATGLKNVSKAITRAWGLGAIVLLNAWIDKGQMSFGEAVAKSINDALLRSPYVPRFGEKGGPYVLVVGAIAAFGLLTALFSAVALRDEAAYPLSRRQRARVRFRGGLVDGAFLLVIVAPCLLAIGQLTGWMVGYEIRFDFMPLFFRALLITLILMPLGYRGRIALRAATRRKAENTMVGVIFGFIGFVAAVGFATFVSTRVFDSPVVELVTLVAALVVSQLAYRYVLTTYYRTEDLA